jgi:hypothetical protein
VTLSLPDPATSQEPQSGGKRASPPTLPSPTPILTSWRLASLEGSQGGGEVSSGKRWDSGLGKAPLVTSATFDGEEPTAGALGGHVVGMPGRPAGNRRQPEPPDPPGRPKGGTLIRSALPLAGCGGHAAALLGRHAPSARPSVLFFARLSKRL